MDLEGFLLIIVDREKWKKIHITCNSGSRCNAVFFFLLPGKQRHDLHKMMDILGFTGQSFKITEGVGVR